MHSFLKNNYLVILITIILFIIPFFWIKPGEMDIGGDGNRLYYYDPQSYLQHDGLYVVDNVIESIRTIEPHFYNLPFVLFLLGIKTIIPSTYFLIAFINGIKLSLGFLSIYLIIKTLLNVQYKKDTAIFIKTASILGGIFYITTPIMIGNYDKALLSQNQVFLNPLLFLLLLTYSIKQQFRYIIYAILVTVLFTTNFSWVSAPPFFSFFPLAVLFLFIYSSVILKKRINFIHIINGLLLLIGLHAFHLIPEAYSLLQGGGYVNERVFNKDNMLQQLNYFYGILPFSKLTHNIFEYSPLKSFPWLSIVPAFLIFLGLSMNKARNRTIALTGIFFIITLYLVTASITNTGIKVYEFLFMIPGFSMFRNFIGQWAFVYAFFYSLLFGLTVYIVLQKIKNKYIITAASVLICICSIAGAYQFFNGELVNKVHFQSKEVKIAMIMDRDYEKVLSEVRSLKEDGAIISFPFTDCCYSVIHGENNGAYVGTSPLTVLTGRKDYNGYVVISPFGEVFLQLVKENEYESIKKLLGLLNIKYIYYNADPKVYDDTFSGYPYSTVRNYFPQSQKEYKVFISKIAEKRIYKAGNYEIYKVDDAYYKPHFYTADSLNIYKNTTDDWLGKTGSFFVDKPATVSAHLEVEACKTILDAKVCIPTEKKIGISPQLSFHKINPAKYSITVKDADGSYFLVFAETFHEKWAIYLKPEKEENSIQSLLTPESITNKHVLINGYANAWYISPKDVNHKKDYTLIVEMTDQRMFYIGVLITAITAILAGIITFFLSRR